MNMDSPSLLKDVGRQVVVCAGCAGNQLMQGSSVSLKRCAKCRSVLYCSAECQRTHWAAEHKRVCKKRARELEKLRREHGDEYVSDWEQWTRNSQLVLMGIAVSALQAKASELRDATTEEAEPDAVDAISAETLTDGWTLFIGLEHEAKCRVPFRVKNHELMSNEAVRTRSPDVADQLVALRTEMSKAIPPRNVLFTLWATVNNHSRILPIMIPLEVLRCNVPALDVTSWGGAEYFMSLLNNGFAGAGTTRAATNVGSSSTDNRKSGRTAASLKTISDVNKYMTSPNRERSHVFTTFVVHALDMHCKPSQRRAQSHRVLIDAYCCPEKDVLLVKSFKVMKLSNLLQEMYAVLDEDSLSALEAKDFPPSSARSAGEPVKEMFPVTFRVLDSRNMIVQYDVVPLCVELEAGCLIPRKSRNVCKKDAVALFDILKEINAEETA